MKKMAFLIVSVFILAATGWSLASFPNAPHDSAHQVTCNSCHEYGLSEQVWPPDYPPTNPTGDDTFNNYICLRCHDGTQTGIPEAGMHSQLKMRGTEGWTTECVACHDPHLQLQLSYLQTHTDDLYLATGDISNVTYDAPTKTSTITYTSLANLSANWSANGEPLNWNAKMDPADTSRGLILVSDKDNPSATYEITGTDPVLKTVNVVGDVTAFAYGSHFGVIYGQMIRNKVDYPGQERTVKFFDPIGGFPGAGGLVDFGDGTTPLEGICQVCHTQTTFFKYNQTIDSQGGLHDLVRCTDCHSHAAGLVGLGGGGPDHGLHMGMTGMACDSCHYYPIIRDGNGDPLFLDDLPLATTKVCDLCHHDGTKICGVNNDEPCPPNKPEFRNNWNTTFELNCDGCHKGRAFATPAEEQMETNGHQRLVGESWIRHYPCTYCHYTTVNGDGSLTSLHLNHQKDVSMDPQWAIGGAYPDPSYDPVTTVCLNVYCHTDGTTENPAMKDYPWTGGPRDCNSCHSHDPDEAGSCTGCHEDRTWSDEQRWLSAMPMYTNTGPGTPRANSHFRHVFTGFSCDDCHVDTVVGGCTDCHGETLPPQNETMNEIGHVNATYHVNRVKNIGFKDGGIYDPQTKTCANTNCHTGNPPVWGGSVHDDVVCKECHGTTMADMDDFGKFNDARARLNLTEWVTSGHGRPGEIDPVTQMPKLDVNQYGSGNPPANFPDKGCWYCHDSRVLHQNEERPFRLIQHEQFNNRFEKECVFCHMTGDDVECLGCHNATESLAPQLDNILADTPVNPPYTISQPDHSTYNVNGQIAGEASCNASICHVDDPTRHKANAGVWTTEQQADVKNSYLQMGVCLKCHDDDSGGQCDSCHTGPQYGLGFDPADLDPELAGYTAGMIVPQVAKAASFHFGYKHYAAYEASVNADLITDVTNDDATTTRYLLDSDQTWIPDQYAGLQVVINPGTVDEISRPIIRNSDTQLTVAPAFPDSDPVIAGEQPVPAGTPYIIKDIVWKGGKFCWDCHDPHGDNNIYMVQDKIATRTDGIVGKPIEGYRASVTFTRKQSGADYVRDSAPYDGLCNVCHTDPDMYYREDYGGTHNAGRICTECHEHRFTDNHASGNACNTCHTNRPVPRHTGFSQARDCTKCHKDAIKGRMNVMLQFTANSHHVQGVEVTNKHCYACHWESTPEGVINLEYHEGYNYETHESLSGQDRSDPGNIATVDLVIWNEDDDPLTPGIQNTDPTKGGRPTVYDADGQNNDDTAIEFDAYKVDVSQEDVDLADQRAQVDQITVHCLGCHSDQNNDSEPFEDCKTPRQYAWDRNSIDARYSETGTAVFGKYSDVNATQKAFTKAFSAHGNAVNNGGGFNASNGEDVIDPVADNTRRGQVGAELRSYNVQCFDCHSSHGSMVGGNTSSYYTFNGTLNGGNLKETQAGKGGYAVTYRATANPDPASENPFEAGAGQCFDCHESAMISTTLNPLYKSPWGFEETFGAEAPILGYRDSIRFGDGDRGVTDRFSYKHNTIAGGHLRSSHMNPDSPNFDDTGASDINAVASINGLCTPCHDPHGVSPSMGENMAYALPLLKGTWMTTPYKEDVAASGNPGSRFQNGGGRNSNRWTATRPPQQRADGRGPGAWRTDRNTFNEKDLSVKSNLAQLDSYGRISEPAEQFAGLCLGCHPKDSLTTEASVTPTQNLQWKSVERIHRSVKGWGVPNGEDEREHSFTCSKCHSAHISGLPRLMRTNCLNYSHRNQAITGGSPGQYNNYYGQFPFGWYNHGDLEFSATDGESRCHGAPSANGSASWPANQSWNEVTPW